MTSVTPPASPPAEDAPNTAYSLDALAELSGVPPRTIRFYRQCGLVDPPRRSGRQVFYGPEHLARLRTVAGLRAQGLGLEAIAKVLDDPQGSRDSFAPLLAIGEELRHPWVEDREAVMNAQEVLAVYGIDSPDDIPLLEKFDVISPVPRSRPKRYVVPSVGMLELAGRMQKIGVLPELVYQASVVMQGHAAAIAQELIELFAAQPSESFTGWPEPESVSRTFAELQAAALRAMSLAFAREMEAALEAFVEQGGVFDAARRAAGDP